MGRGVSSCINYTEEESLVGIVPLTYCLLLDLDSFFFFFFFQARSRRGRFLSSKKYFYERKFFQRDLSLRGYFCGSSLLDLKIVRVF